MGELLLKLVRRYRRRWSGRRPFAGRVCTFSHLESCSSYAERLLSEPRVRGWRALAATYRRLRRCHDAGLYRSEGGGLAAGPLYDGLTAEGTSACTAWDEEPRTLAALLRARARLCWARGEVALAKDAWARASALSREEVPPLVVRAARSAGRRTQRSIARAAALGSACAAMGIVAVVHDASAWAVVLSMASACWLAVAHRRHARWQKIEQRLAQCEIVAHTREAVRANRSSDAGPPAALDAPRSHGPTSRAGPASPRGVSS